MFTRIVLSLIVIAGLALPAQAAKPEKKAAKKADQIEAIFKKLDGNNDGKVSKEEFAKLNEVKQAAKKAKDPAKADKKKAEKKKKADKKADKNKAEKKKKADKKKTKLDELFTKLDTNKDGSLSKDEFKKLAEVKEKKKKV